MPKASPPGMYLQFSELPLGANALWANDHSSADEQLCDRLSDWRDAVRSAIAQPERRQQVGRGTRQGRVTLAAPIAQEGQTA